MSDEPSDRIGDQDRHAVQQRGRRPQRPCRDYERPWKDKCVDKNLKDEWLEDLNALLVFDLVSVCEGHPQSMYTCQPHLNLQLRPAAVEPVFASRTNVLELVGTQINKLFSESDTDAEMELKSRICIRPFDTTSTREVTANIGWLGDRRSEAASTDVVAWFEKIVPRVQQFDQVLHEFINASD